jgi:hypothetical protein
MNPKKIQLTALCLGLLAANFACAEKMLDSQKLIPNLNSALTALKAQTSLPAIFPTQIPKNPTLTTFYIYIDPTLLSSTGYTISIDSTSTCKGAHYCQVGALTINTTGQPQIYKDMNGNVLTKTINLTPTQQASYTPGHAMGDYWAPMLEWRQGAYFYHLNWQVRDQKALVNTALSLKPYAAPLK